MKTFKAFLLIFFISSVLFQSNAQHIITGSITDNNSNPVNNSFVEIINASDTTLIYSDYTDENGFYEINANIVDIKEKKTITPSEFLELRNYPNPFNPSTIIYFKLPKADFIDISIYDILGRQVKSLYNNFHNSGVGTINWNGDNNQGVHVAAGIYFCMLKTKSSFLAHKMLLLDGGSIYHANQYLNKPIEINDIRKSDLGKFLFNIRINHSEYATCYIKNISCDQDTSLDITLYREQTKTIGSNGGAIETDGYVLNIPASALAEDTEITLTPFIGNSMHEWCAAGVNIMPLGIEFIEPVSLSMPLPENWPVDHNPLIINSFSNDQKDFYNTGLCAEINTSMGKWLSQSNKNAGVVITQSGKYGVIENCHKGTIAYLAHNFKSRGCELEQLWSNVKENFPNVETDFVNKPETGHFGLQAFLGTYFDEVAGFNIDQPVTSQWKDIIDNFNVNNKNVVILFSRNQFTAKNPNGFYSRVPHSASLEMVNGKLKLRNSVVAKPRILKALIDKNKANALWYPKGNEELTAASFETFRYLKSGASLENELSDSSHLFNSWPKLSARGIPWNAVKFFVAKDSDDRNPCATPLPSFDYADIYVNGIIGKFSLKGTYYSSDTQVLNEHVNAKITATDSSYVGSWDESIGLYSHMGYLEVVVNSEGEPNRFLLNQHISFSETASRTFTIYGQGDPLKYNEFIDQYTLRGDDVCKFIVYYIFEEVANETSSRTMSSHSCDANSVIAISLWNE